jgi:MATE family, multidrug and toxin extrusion protein
MIPLGMSIAASVRVGNQLGAGKPMGALRSAKLTAYATLVVMVALGALLLALRGVWPYVFSDDQDVVHLSARLLPMLAGLTVLDGLQGSLSGVLRGCGKQVVGAVVNVTCYYVIGLPVSALLSFHFPLGLYGLWLGQSLAAFLCSTSFVVFVFFFRWYNVPLMQGGALEDGVLLGELESAGGKDDKDEGLVESATVLEVELQDLSR